MQYAFLLLEIAVLLWLIFNIYQSWVAFRHWQKEADQDNPFITFLIKRLGVLGNTFVYTIVYTVIALGCAYLLYEIGALIFE